MKLFCKHKRLDGIITIKKEPNELISFFECHKCGKLTKTIKKVDKDECSIVWRFALSAEDLLNEVEKPTLLEKLKFARSKCGIYIQPEK
jgi:hypothetical protein